VIGDAKKRSKKARIVAATGGRIDQRALAYCRPSANEAGIAFTLDDVGEVFGAHTLIRQFASGGKYTRRTSMTSADPPS